MEVLVIRHGESANNVIAMNLVHKFIDQKGEIDLEGFEKIWLTIREDDPPMSLLGKQQAALTAATYGPTVCQKHARGIEQVADRSIEDTVLRMFANVCMLVILEITACLCMHREERGLLSSSAHFIAPCRRVALLLRYNE